MMTEQEKREKIIKGLECCWDVQSGWKDARYVCSTCPYTDNCIPCETLAPLMEDALALLKGQEPVKPTWRCGYAYCGKCGYKLHWIVDKNNYCPECGRAVKWE